ncbi:hypothetical protein [Streptomyces sp. WAC01280]|uniref:hypothetical protein n=1 Tax=Streptomyces sp. WAC01280 TaxID=2487424 RepID=UPI000F799CB9|nr:hypothetical protein [Streptomyces sp. WAC01280]RSS50081.1 hypothetical protein EF909_39230 [Streptomyces sp. WAC01280]
MVRRDDELPTQRIAGVEYLSCEWCGQAVSQLGTRTPRRYCKRSHRQRAFEARKHGEPMLRDKPAVAGVQSATGPEPVAVEPDPPAAAPVVVPLPQRPSRPEPPKAPTGPSRPVIPLPDPAVPRVRQKRLFPPFPRRAEQTELFADDEVQPDA